MVNVVKKKIIGTPHRRCLLRSDRSTPPTVQQLSRHTSLLQTFINLCHEPREEICLNIWKSDKKQSHMSGVWVSVVQ